MTSVLIFLSYVFVYFCVHKDTFLNTKKIVITGGPSTGKTSVINALEKKGHLCLHEVIRSFTSIEQEKNDFKEFKTNPIVSVDDPMAFNQKVLDARLAQYQKALNSDQELVFFDRGVHDVLAYMYCFNQEYGQDFIVPSENTKYDAVFIMPPWPAIFTSDSERFETYEEGLKVHDSLVHMYEKFGYEVVLVPKESVENRVAFIESYLKAKK